MLAKLSSYTLVGIDAMPVEGEVDVSSASMPKMVLVGLAEAAVRESTHRVERALVNSGYQRSFDRVVINLAPARLHSDKMRPGRRRNPPRAARSRPGPGTTWGSSPCRPS